MSTVTVGRRLDDGEPVAGTGFEVDPNDEVADHLRERTSSLYSNPITEDWTTELVPATQTDGEFARGLGIFSPGSAGPPEHYHVGYEESFEVLRGEFAFEIEGKERRVGPGESVAAPPDTPHSLRNVGDSVGVTLTETRPAARTLDVVTTQFGLAHEGKLDDEGDPGLLQGMTLAAEMADDTVFTSPPPAIAVPMAKALAPVASLLGYEATYEKYQRDAFWHEHVEQPDL